MAIDYGSDITFDGEDINPNLSLTVDSSVVLEALSFRLQTDNGSLWYDPDYGYNINSLLKSPVVLDKNGQSKIQSRVQQEVLKDTRVKSADVLVTDFNLQNQKLTISINITLKNGEQNSLVFSISG